jgi:2-polyprenyl-3-methyl-5-hydroxy-6-metoxy-1,4-benzoquinol methylase
MKLIRKYADNTNSRSVSNRFRKKRFKLFLELIKDLPKPVKILDIGGTENFWEQMGLAAGSDIDLLIINIEEQKVKDPKIKFIKADARDLSIFKDKEFDVIFSNSVIEHVGDLKDQMKMAKEILRIGKLFFIQTPNYYFPIEPHFLFPLFQFFPARLKAFLLMNFSLGWFEKSKSKAHAMAIIDSIHLLKKKELKLLFPKASIIKEKFLSFTKSFIVIKYKTEIKGHKLA